MDSRDSQSSEPSRGNLFTGPSSSKRAAKKNSRFSPEVEPATRQKLQPSASDKLQQAAAAFEERDEKTPVTVKKRGKVKEEKGEVMKTNIKERYRQFGLAACQALPQKDFEIPSVLHGIEMETTEPPARNKSSQSGRPSRGPAHPPPPPSTAPSFDQLACFDFEEEGGPSTSSGTEKKKRGRPSLKKMTVKMEEPDEEVDHPPTGSEKKEETKGTPRGRPRGVKVKDEPPSDSETAAPVAAARSQSAMVAGAGRGRKSKGGTVPAPAAPVPTTVGRGRKSTGGGGVMMVKEELVSDGEEQLAARRRGSFRRETAQEQQGGQRRIISTDEGADEVGAPSSAKRKSIKIEETPLHDVPSTSASAASAAVDRSTSRKRGRGRPSFAFLEAERKKAEREDREKEEVEEVHEPPAKKHDRRRSTRSTGDAEEVHEEGVEISPSASGKSSGRRGRPTVLQMQPKDVKDEEEEEEVKLTRRRSSFRGSHGEEAAAAASAATPSRGSTRGRGSSSRGGKTARGAGRPRRTVSRGEVELEEDSEEVHDVEMDEHEEEAKPSTSRMLLDATSPSARSGYGQDPSEVDGEHESTKEGEEERDEAEASTSAATASPVDAAVPAKRGRGRPRIYFDRPRNPYPYVPVAQRRQQEAEQMAAAAAAGEQPLIREGRRQTAPSQKYAEFITGAGTKQHRASAGAGTALRGDIPSPRARPPTPPPPEVKAAPGSALSIMRALNKKKLPSIRTPSPVPVGRRSASLNSLAAAAATLADAPPIGGEKKEEEKKLSPPGPSRRRTSAHPPPRRSDEAKKKEEEEEKKEEEEKDEEKMEKEKKEEKAEKRVRLVEYDDTDSEGEEENTVPPQSEHVWIAPKNIRRSRSKSRPNLKDAVTVETEADGEKKEEKKEEGEEEREEQKETEDSNDSKTEDSQPSTSAKKEETAEELLARWTDSTKAIDQKRLEAGLPILPPSADDVAAPMASRASRRSVNAPARFGDFELNFSDARRRSTTVTSSSALPLSPVVSDAGSKKSRRKKEETPSTPSVAADDEAEDDEQPLQQQPTGSRKRSKKEKKPRLVLKLKLGNKGGTAAASAADGEGKTEEGEGEEEKTMMEEEAHYDPEGDGAPDAAAAAPVVAATPAARKKEKKPPRQKAFVAKWKRPHRPHLGFIELDDKQVESVTLTVAGAIDAMLMEVCGDGIVKSTLTPKEQSSEHSRFSVAKRRVLGIIPPPLPPGVPKPKSVPIPIPPREERTKRIRHAPQSKEYDNLAATLSAPAEAATTSFTALAGLYPERKQSERRRESRQEAAHRRESAATIPERVSKENEGPPAEERKPKKEKKREREREETANKNAISYDEFLRRKAHCLERLPGRVLNDPTDFFYREIFTDEVGDGMIEDATLVDLDVIGLTEPRPDEPSTVPPIGMVAEEQAAKVIEMFPRPQPFPDDDDDDEEEREWMEEDVMKALSSHSESRRELVENVLEVINSQRMADLAVQGTKGAQDVLFNSHVQHALRLKELLPVFSLYRLGESSWLHRTLIRLLPAHLMSVYLELFRFLRYSDSKLAAELGKALMKRGVDAEWDALFHQEPTDDDRTEPMLFGSYGPATAAASSDEVTAALSDEVTATIEAVLKALERPENDKEREKEKREEAASPDSNEGGLMIDEGEETVVTPAATAASGDDAVEVAVVAADAAAAPLEPETEEKEIVKEVKKLDLDVLCSLLADATDKKVREANTETVNNSITSRELADVIPILVAPVFDIPDAPDSFVNKNRPYEYMYRLLRYATPFPSEFRTLKPKIPEGECSIAEAMDAAVDYVVAAVKAAVKNKGNGRVVLFGWGLSCYINHRVVQLLHGISAIVDFAFPLKTLDGWRGSPDDDINLTYCPTLFVMGAEAEDFDPVELLMMRQNIIQPSGAIIVGSADSQLNVSTLRLSRERITQKVAVRMIMEQVIKFVNHPANQLERAKLVPLQLNNVYFVEPSAVKAYSAQEGQQAHVQSAAPARRTITVDGAGTSPYVNQALERRRLQQMEEKKKRKRSRMEEQTTAAGRLASSIASSAAPITKRSRTDDLPSTSYGGRVGDFRFSVPGPSPLASPSLNSPTFRSRPAILSHSHHNYHHNYSPALPSPITGGPSSSSAASSSGFLLQPATPRPANAAAAAAPSPRGPLDPASISLA